MEENSEDWTGLPLSDESENKEKYIINVNTALITHNSQNQRFYI